MNKVIAKAMEINKFGANLPELEIGDVVTLGEVWDGNGETPEYGYSYYLTDEGEDGESNCRVDINYEFEIVEKKGNELETLVKITDISLV